jgi:hypothetical protein
MLLDPRPGSVTGAFFLCGFEGTSSIIGYGASQLSRAASAASTSTAFARYARCASLATTSPASMAEITVRSARAV